MSTFSIPKGAVEAGNDDGSVSAIHSAWKYMHLVGIFPWIHRLNAWFLNVIAARWISKTKGLRSMASVLFVLNKTKRSEVAEARPILGVSYKSFALSS